MGNIEKFIVDAFIEELGSVGATMSHSGLTEFGSGQANVLCTIAAEALKHVRNEAAKARSEPVVSSPCEEKPIKFRWRGKYSDELTREELLEVILTLHRTNPTFATYLGL